MTVARKTGYQARQYELQKRKYRMDGLITENLENAITTS